MRIGSLGLGLASLVWCAVAAHAQVDDDDFARPGFYLSAYGTYGLEDFRHTAWADCEDSLGAGGTVGYRFSALFAAEVQGEWLEGFDLEDFSGEFDAWLITGNGKFYLPFGRIQPFLAGGAGFMQVGASGLPPGTSASNQEGFVLRGGGGVDFYATENIALSLGVSYVFPTSDDIDDWDFVSFTWGIQYRF